MTRVYPPKAETPEARQAFLRHYAGVLTSEAQARAGSAFAVSLRQWAANALREAEGLSPEPTQIEMFPILSSLQKQEAAAA